MLSQLTAAVLAFATPTAVEEAPDRLLTPHGVELRVDERVFVLFAALNAAGFADESLRKGPPLRAPVFHPIRRSARGVFRRPDNADAVKGLLRLFDENPAEVDTYLKALLSGERTAYARLKRRTQAALQVFREQVNVAGAFQQLAGVQREHAKSLMAAVTQDMETAVKVFKAEEYQIPGRLVAIPNPLDSHDAVRRVETDETVWLTVGPGTATARRSVVAEALRPSVRRLVDRHYRSAGRVRAAWRRLKTRRAIVDGYRDGADYLTEALAYALAWQAFVATTGTKTRKAEKTFLAAETRAGRLWTGAALQVVRGLRGQRWGPRLGRALARMAP